MNREEIKRDIYNLFDATQADLDKEYDCNYSKFDIDKHAEHYINYLEVAIAPDGDIDYCIPSHQQYLERVLRNKLGNEGFENAIKHLQAVDYMDWLVEQTGYISVWDNFCIAHTVTHEQYLTLKKLAETSYKRIDSKLYKGDIPKEDDNVRDKH